MKEKILFVDDEPYILEAVRRQLGRRFAIDTAGSGDDALRKIREGGSYAVVVSDMRMPGMTGTQLLTQVRQEAPDTVRVILSGHADLDATIEAVNAGHIFRFFTKPCPPEILAQGVQTALDQYRLINAEKEVLEQTLSGAVKMLIEVMGLTNPVAYHRATRVRGYANAIAEAVDIGSDWQLQLAATLSQVGCITLPAEILTKVYAGSRLDDEESRMYRAHPDLGARLISGIPRLGGVAEIIAGQMQRPDLTNMPQLVSRWDQTRRGVMILRAATELDELITAGIPPQVALQKMVESWPGMPQAVADVIRCIRLNKGEATVRIVGLADLLPGMVLDEDLKSKNGIRLVPQGHEVTNAVMARLRTVAEGVGICEPFRVRITPEINMTVAG